MKKPDRPAEAGAVGALTVNHRVHQHEVPCGGDLGGQCRPEQVVPAQVWKKNQSAAVLTTMPVAPTSPNDTNRTAWLIRSPLVAGRSRNCRASRSVRSLATCRRNVTPWRSEALESPAARGSKR